MPETVRMVCPVGRKHVELWAGYTMLVLAVITVVLDPTHWASIVLGLLLALLGAALAVHGHRLQAPVLEFDEEEFRYTLGRYSVSVALEEIGSYHVLPGRIRSLGLCDTTGRPMRFPSLRNLRTARSYLPLTGMTAPSRVEMFMAAAGIPPRDRSLTQG